MFTIEGVIRARRILVFEILLSVGREEVENKRVLWSYDQVGVFMT